MRRKRRIGVPIEWHADEIYTRAMHERVNNELYHSGRYYTIIKDEQQQRIHAGTFQRKGEP